MAYLLTGAAGLPLVEVAQQLQRSIDQESDGLAHACAVQGLVKAVARMPGDEAGVFAAAARARLQSGSVLDRIRVRSELESVALLPGERSRLLHLLDFSAIDEVASVRPATWPAEGV
jgi:hypothetical protein